MASGLDFEKPILELELKIAELKALASDGSIDLAEEINKLESRLEKVRREIFESLTPWQKVQIARHPKRPYTMDYINMIMVDFIELHGDRMFQDDKAIIGGFAKIDGEKILIIGHQKGKDTKENLMRNFGSAHPEGYRKAMRLMELAEKFNVPIVTFIDTPGAYPGIGAEERGQANSIAHNLREMIFLRVPVIVIVIGEGGSGGALGIGIGDRVYVMENAYYSVISPEGCAAILWKDRLKAPEAAEVLKLTAKDLIGLKIIDGEIPEPLGGAHRDPEKAAQALKRYIKKALKELKILSIDKLVDRRYEKFRGMGDI
ncbi:MAG: acetyl-CoA carboxylase carboxyltransferase subunit alpha [Candidatus Omnitrophica bacterium]|nr:acetyl-CoA carboxylase carboxyltransferase subunit alpha [Candidatus Omnitrophota bacterium]MBU1853087.1 acetyl-CoA carboxylase carboxyltransferase subunit alpha [Candidatus Omnitrophota bacterium]